MEAHVRRMFDEWNQLDQRERKLTEFMGGSVFSSLPKEQQELLQEQQICMLAYKHALTKRIQLSGFDPYATTPARTFGQKLIAPSYDTSKDPASVTRLRELAAEMADIVSNIKTEGMPMPDAYMANTVKGNAIREILSAQMWAVKFVTMDSVALFNSAATQQESKG